MWMLVCSLNVTAYTVSPTQCGASEFVEHVQGEECASHDYDYPKGSGVGPGEICGEAF